MVRAEEAVADKLARFRRLSPARDLYDLWWFATSGALDEALGYFTRPVRIAEWISQVRRCYTLTTLSGTGWCAVSGTGKEEVTGSSPVRLTVFVQVSRFRGYALMARS